jgi:hypothetical protein
VATAATIEIEPGPKAIDKVLHLSKRGRGGRKILLLEVVKSGKGATGSLISAAHSRINRLPRTGNTLDAAAFCACAPAIRADAPIIAVTTVATDRTHPNLFPVISVSLHVKISL